MEEEEVEEEEELKEEEEDEEEEELKKMGARMLKHETCPWTHTLFVLVDGGKVQLWKVKKVNWWEMDGSECAVEVLNWAVTAFWVNFDIKTGEGVNFGKVWTLTLEGLR